MSHPSKDILGKDGEELKGKKVVLGVTGSVSAYKAADIARELMRHGAEVHAVMTHGAQEIINPNLMEFATGNPVVTKLTGKIEHVALTTGPEKADAVLIAPATANTIGKIATGIDDTPVTSCVSSALGAGIPILIAPAMHDTMLTHPIIQENVRKLEMTGVIFIAPTMEEGKAKLASPEAVLASVIRVFRKKDMASLKVLITGGPTFERIDSVRVLTNRSSGKMAVALAAAAQSRGARTTLVYGPGAAQPPRETNVIHVQTAEDMHEKVLTELARTKYEMIIAAAAVSDYKPAKPFAGKIESAKAEKLTLRLTRTPKIIEAVKKASPSSFLIIFKAEHSLPGAEIVKRARKRLGETKADLAVVNDVGKEGIGFESDQNEVTVVTSSGRETHLKKASKDVIADQILDLALQELHRR